MDGCNSKCQTEDGYLCTGGSSQTPDSCRDIKGPEVLKLVVTPDNQVIMEFNEEVYLKKEPIPGIWNVNIVGPRGDYKIVWSISSTNLISTQQIKFNI